jgi:hypothetical protein
MAWVKWYFSGLDLGQAADHTALAVAEADVAPGRVPAYTVRHLERFPLGTSYPAVVERVKGLFARDPLPGTLLAADQTGVGRPVVDMLRAAGLGAHLVPVTITGGHETTCDADGYRVPKKELVATLQVLLQSRRLAVVPTLAEAQMLAKELNTFRVKVSTAGNESFEAWRERDHDDLVLAVALAAWLAEQAIPHLVARREVESDTVLRA